MNSTARARLEAAEIAALGLMQSARSWPSRFDADGIAVASELVFGGASRGYYSRVAIPASVADVAHYMADNMLAGLAEWSAEFVDGTELAALFDDVGDRGWKMRVRYATPWPLADREYVYLLRRHDRDDSSVCITYDSVDDDTPLSPGCVRARLTGTLHRVAPIDGENSVLEHLLVTDLAGAIPSWVQRNLLTGAMVKAHVRDARAIRARFAGTKVAAP